MKNIHSRIQIIPMSRCLSHEGIVEKWVDQIAFNILNEGIIKNPVIATKHKGEYVILDGMHRYNAIKQLEIPAILACLVDYFDESIVLEGWDALIFPKINFEEFLSELFPKENFVIEKTDSLEEVTKEVNNRRALLGGTQKNGGSFILKEKDNSDLLESLCKATDRIDRKLHEEKKKVVYIDNSLTKQQWESTEANLLLIRPQFTKEEILERTLKKRLFPPKSTRHLIPERPLRVDVDLSLLRADIDLALKNKVLQDHLKWCHENNRVRYYPESVHVFAD